MCYNSTSLDREREYIMNYRIVRNKDTMKTEKQYPRWDGCNYVYLGINDQWEVVEEVR